MCHANSCCWNFWIFPLNLQRGNLMFPGAALTCDQAFFPLGGVGAEKTVSLLARMADNLGPWFSGISNVDSMQNVL